MCCSMVSLFYFPGIGTLRDYDSDGKGNVKNTIGFMSKTNDPILSWLENGNDKTINLTVSPWTRVQGSPLFSSKLISLLLSNWVTWYEGKKIDRTRSLFFSDAFIGVAVVGSFLHEKVIKMRGDCVLICKADRWLIPHNLLAFLLAVH